MLQVIGRTHASVDSTQRSTGHSCHKQTSSGSAADTDSYIAVNVSLNFYQQSTHCQWPRNRPHTVQTYNNYDISTYSVKIIKPTFIKQVRSIRCGPVRCFIRLELPSGSGRITRGPEGAWPP